jgi:WD40 repeat protein
MSFDNHIVKDINIHTKPVVDLKWNNDGSYIGSISSDRSIKISQLDSSGGAKVSHTIPTNVHYSLICWNPANNSRFALIGDERTVELWDVRGSEFGLTL